MNLKKRLLVILCTCGLLLGVFFHFSFNATMVPGLDEQKSLVIDGLKRKLRAAVALELNNLEKLCNNWSNWQKLILFIEAMSEPNRNKSFVTHQMQDFSSSMVLPAHMINCILVLDRDGNLLYNRNRSHHLEPVTLENMNITSELEEIKERVSKSGSSFKGIINSQYGPMAMAAHPVKGRTGIVILGSFLDNPKLTRLSLAYNEKIRPVSFKNKELFASYLKQMKAKDFFFREDKQEISILFLVKDIFGTPSFILAVDTTYKLLWVAEQHTILYILFTTLSMLILGLLVYYLIEKYINKRVILISNATKSVRGLKDLSTRVSEDNYGDEISTLVKNINRMLDKIEHEKENLQQFEQQLITSEKLVCIGRLSASIAHEINNPVLAISNCIQALKRTCIQCQGDHSNVHKQAVELSETEINRVRTIISNLLDYHRLDKEGFSPVNLDDVLLQSLEILKWSKKLTSIKISTRKEHNFYVYGSKGKLKQVFINLISNAVEATGSGDAELHIELLRSKTEGFCEIHFIDNGQGVSAIEEERLFEPFVSSKEEKGVGLGLYISYKIIENHNGELVYQGSDRGGAHFTIRLPVLEKTTRHTGPVEIPIAARETI